MGVSPSKETKHDKAHSKGDKPSGNASLTDESTTSVHELPESSPQDRKKRRSTAKTPTRKNGVNKNDGSKQSGPVAGSEAVSTHISDDQVQVNLAMADLMAYLQVVATNSQNLPMTRRDDPELRKAVSNLTPDDYARKSAAFIPADVRVIAGSFTKYGRVWDLPTSEEFDACDGAQEPGRSYGGACCNTMLKVLYDAANEAADAAHQAAATDAIFDEDDEESLMNISLLGRSRTFESLVLGLVPSTITWATLLRKMKAEIDEIEYAQNPVVSSTRKIDLNKPFSLLPEGFDPKKNVMRSLLIGCNYADIPGAELKASHDDVRSMKDYIVNVHGFPETKGLMTVLLDDNEHKHPTHLNIVESLKSLAEQSQPGDVIFIQFSGHGGRVLDTVIDSEAESYDEAFAPSDYQVSGLIRDTLIYKILLAPMRYGVTVTMLIDTCDTGMMLDLPYVWTTRNERREAVAKLTPNDDFSFIRFLKVVKTLYEASSFTQLGNTVQTALKKPGATDEDANTIVEESSLAHASLATGTQGKALSGPPPQQSAILKALAACTSPESMPECSEMKEKVKKKKEKGKSRDTEDATEGPSSSQASFLDQVMSCTLGGTGGEFSDDDTYNGRSIHDDETYGTDTLGETTTYDSFTDGEEGYESHRSRRNKARRR